MKTFISKVRLSILRAAKKLFLVGVLIVLGIPNSGFAQMIYLGPIKGQTSYARAVNNKGQVVGQSTNWQYAFLWENGVMTDLGSLGGGQAYALGINDNGQIVGASQKSSGAWHAFLWENGKMTDLGIEGDAWDINNRGQIAGTFYTQSRDLHIFVWEHGVMTDIGPERLFSPFINDNGQVVGGETITTATGTTYRLWVWQDGTITELGTGIGAFWPDRMNDNGQIIGRSSVYGSGSFLWENGVITDLGGYYSIAYDINNYGQVVGDVWSNPPNDPTPTAVLWDCGKTIYLQTVGVGSLATGINDHGQVVGFTWLPSGEGSAFITKYVPEPAIISVSPKSHDFGQVIVGSTSTETFTVTNKGSGCLKITSLSITGRDTSEFLIQNDQCAGKILAPNLTCMVDVVFAAKSEGEKLASLSIYSNDPVTPIFEVLVLGIVVGRVEVTIDIKPGSFPNSVNPNSKGKIPVAILSTKVFNAVSQVVLSSLTFGRTGDERSLAFCQGSEDVNKDKLQDLVCHFYTQHTGFQCHDTRGILKGETKDGTPIVGSDSVNIVSCK